MSFVPFIETTVHQVIEESVITSPDGNVNARQWKETEKNYYLALSELDTKGLVYTLVTS